MTDHSTIHTTQWGTSGPRLVLVHGGVQGSTLPGTAHFAQQVQLVDRGYHLIIPDRPGHGRTPSLGRPDDAAADGAWVADLLGTEAHLVGHSFGACVALAAATTRPSAVKTLTLIEPAMQPVAITKLPVFWFVLRMLATLKRPRSAEARIKVFSALMRIPTAMGGSAPSKEEYAAMGQAVTRLIIPQPQTLRRQLVHVRQAQIPLLVVTGGWSRGMDGTADVVAQLGHGTRVTIRAPHHFPQAIADDFNAVLDHFISDHA